MQFQTPGIFKPVFPFHHSIDVFPSEARRSKQNNWYCCQNYLIKKKWKGFFFFFILQSTVPTYCICWWNTSYTHFMVGSNFKQAAHEKKTVLQIKGMGIIQTMTLEHLGNVIHNYRCSLEARIFDSPCLRKDITDMNCCISYTLVCQSESCVGNLYTYNQYDWFIKK